MDEQKKPFDTTSIVLLLLVAGVSDIADLATDLLFPVPVIGQIVFVGNSLVVSPIVWAIIQLSFIIKTGAGRASLVAVAGGLGNIANIPGSETVTTIIAIAIANNPKLSEVATVVGKKIGKDGNAAERKTVNAFEEGKKPDAKFKELGHGSEYFKENEEWLKKNAPDYYEREMAAAGEKRGPGMTEKGVSPETVNGEVSPEALGEKPEAMEELQQKLLKETPNVTIDNRNNEVDLRRK